MDLPHTLTRVRAPLVAGGYGSEERDWANATRVDLSANVQSISSTEDVVAQQRTETRWRAFLGVTADLLVTDRTEWGGKTLEVVGDVETWDQGSPAARHRLAVLRAVSGG